MRILSIATLGWEPRPDVWILVLTLAVLYRVALVRIGPRASTGSTVVTTAQATSFVLGLGALWLASDWPIDELADQRMFSVHMVQHLLLILVVPALLLLGTPGWLLRWLLRPGSRRFRVVRSMARAVPALVLFNVVFVVAHIPQVIDLTVRNAGTDFVEHTVLLATGFIAWLPVLSPLPEIPRLRPIVCCLYLFGWSVLPTVPAAFLTFGSSPVYSVYGHSPKLWGLDALQDQQIAGLIMKLGMGLLLWAVIAVVFFRWAADEERRDRTGRVRTSPAVGPSLASHPTRGGTRATAGSSRS